MPEHSLPTVNFHIQASLNKKAWHTKYDNAQSNKILSNLKVVPMYKFYNVCTLNLRINEILARLKTMHF